MSRIEYQTINNQRLGFAAYRVVAHEEYEAGRGSTRLFFDAGHIAIVLVPFAQVTADLARALTPGIEEEEFSVEDLEVAADLENVDTQGSTF